MSLLVFGLNHRTADVDLRGQLAYASEDFPAALQRIQSTIQGLSEAVILSTCNRTEIHCVVENPSIDPLAVWLAQDREASVRQVRKHAYHFWDEDALAHAIRLASGLDSQVIGETQILGQFKSAYKAGKDADSVGRLLRLVENIAIQTAKQVHSDTDVGKNPVSVSFAAVKMIQQLFTSLDEIKVLLIGAGTNIRLLLEHLISIGVKHLTIANRTFENAQKLANESAAETIQFDAIRDQLANYDVVMSSTGSPDVILSQDDFANAANQRRRKPIMVVDLAIPRDIDSSVSDLSDIYLYTVDDLTGIIEENLANRRVAAEQASILVEQGVENFRKENRIARVGPLVSEFRSQNEKTRSKLLDAAKHKLETGQNPDEVIERLSHDLTKQLSHKPTVLIRYLGDVHSPTQLNAIKKIIDTDETPET